MVELNGVRIWAIDCDAGAGPGLPRKLTCGTLAVEDPRAASGPAGGWPGRIPLPGRPGVSIPFVGVFRLVVSGDRVAVFGASVEPVG